MIVKNAFEFVGWYRQYDAHRDDFIDRYGRSTEELLFHGEIEHLLFASERKENRSFLFFSQVVEANRQS